MITCQFSLYPLRQPELGPMLDVALNELRSAGLEPRVGTMSSYVEGDADAVFEGLKRAFKAAAEEGDVVLVTTVSNACAPEAERGA